MVTADDWGQTPETTDRIVECARRGVVSSVSAMVFMEDSERAAALARREDFEAGLHLNLTTPFSGPDIPAGLLEHQQAIARCLLRHRLARVVFHPRLVRAFEHVVAAQLDEFRRLYAKAPDRLDGHHHMHLCTNVLFQRLLPAGALVRRSFSFRAAEKSPCNRLYRRGVDAVLARRHRTVDFFFPLSPLSPPARLRGIFATAQRFVVELETHPVEPHEYRFLTGGGLRAWLGRERIVPPSVLLGPARAGVGG